MNPASSITDRPLVAGSGAISVRLAALAGRASRRPRGRAARRSRASSPTSSRASSAARVRWRWITSQAYISVNVDDAEQQREQHQAVELDVAVGPEHARLLVEAAPQLDAEVHERDLQHGEQGQHRRALGPLLRRAAEAAHGEVADVRDEEERRGGESGVPPPEHAPGEPAPQHPDDERDAHEQHADLGAGAGEAVPAERVLAGEEVQSPTPGR